MICDVSEAAEAIASGEKVLTVVLVPFRNCRRTASISSGSIESFGSTQTAWTMLFRRIRTSPKRLTADTTRSTRSSFEMRYAVRASTNSSMPAAPSRSRVISPILSSLGLINRNACLRKECSAELKLNTSRPISRRIGSTFAYTSELILFISLHRKHPPHY